MDSTARTPLTSKYVREFESLFVPIKVAQLSDRAKSGKLRRSQFRSLCWRYFLRCLPEKYDDWVSSCTKSRQDYDKIKMKHMSSKKPGESMGSEIETIRVNSDTITNDKKSPRLAGTSRDSEDDRQYKKAASQCDHRDVFKTIERDVVRTYPDMEFFRQTEMQGTLENVLFNFASENPHLSYKQGMHELLATLLYVLHTDSQTCLINYQGGYANENISTLLDLRFLEHDVFHLFSALMKSIESWYQNDEILIPETTGHFDGNINRSSEQHQGSVLGNKLSAISEKIVKLYDPELYNHLEALQIAPQIYGIRWMRLLFGREFEFIDLLTVWDAIICDSNPMSMTDYIFASMLITIREVLVNGDYTDCLNKLMRHQFNAGYVIKTALHLREPTVYLSVQGMNPQYNRNSAKQIQTPARRPRPMTDPVKEYEMQEIQSHSSANRRRGALNISTEPYDDLNSIVDYCWRLLSEQIDLLQRCLPKEKSLHSEDEIFVALAQLKKVRDVLKGSLRLEDARVAR